MRQVLKRLKKRPIDYFQMFYADTALFGAYDATVCGLAFFGADHVLFASDAPFDPEKGPMYIRETIGIVDRLPDLRRRAGRDLLRECAPPPEAASGHERASFFFQNRNLIL